MGNETKYGRVTTQHGEIPEDEPVFLFRAQDQLLPQVLDYYRDLCKEAGSPLHHLTGIAEAKMDVAQWQDRHPGDVKVPGTRHRERNR